MPQYLSLCPKCGAKVHEFRAVKELGKGFWCVECNVEMDIVIQAPILVKAVADVCYDSPVTGEPVTSWASRREDLAKHGCEAYDPGRKQDYHRRITESESALDKQVEETVEEAIHKMTTGQRGKLYSELTEQGTTAEVIRRAP